MGAGAGDDAGMFGWKEWKMPKLPIHKYETTPSPKTDGSHDPMDVYLKKSPDKYTPPNQMFNPVRYPNMSASWSLLHVFQRPMFNTFFTDMSGLVINGSGQECESFELQAMECMEYYGVKQGVEACKDWYDDLMECRYQTKTMLRVKHMRYRRSVEWGLEYLQGKRDKVYEDPPKFHAYITPEIDPKTLFQTGTTT